MVREIVRIDEEKCDGCGQCVPNCAEGALRIVNGKARLVAENLCDGMGACLGHCPRGAIIVEKRAADEFDEDAVSRHLKSPINEAPALAPVGECPGSRMRMMKPRRRSQPVASDAPRQSHLGQWPVQLALVPPAGPIWIDADVLIAADCVPFAYPDFHEQLLSGRTLAIACPKLDDVEPYIQKLAAIFKNNSIRSVTVARMEVPCCGGLVRAVDMALRAAGRDDLELREIVIGIDGVPQ